MICSDFVFLKHLFYFVEALKVKFYIFLSTQLFLVNFVEFDYFHQALTIKSLVTCLEYLLAHNYFRFDEVRYLQIEGAPMGSKFTPCLANLFMAWWEEQFVFSVYNPFGEALGPYHSFWSTSMGIYVHLGGVGQLCIACTTVLGIHQ